MKVYIATHSRELGNEYKSKLEKLGYEINSSWLNEEFKKSTEMSDEESRLIAVRDVNEVGEANILFLIAGEEKYSGGKFVELGVAIALEKIIFLIGRRENCLAYHNRVIQITGDIPSNRQIRDKLRYQHDNTDYIL